MSKDRISKRTDSLISKISLPLSPRKGSVRMEKSTDTKTLLLEEDRKNFEFNETVIF